MCGRRALVPAHKLGQFEDGSSAEEFRSMVYRQMGSLIIAAHDSFLRYRQARQRRTPL
jgi:hypothetical protein